ncbi:uncharacterized protein LOC123508197 [Portunus trituberculatus]|uniref:uncharacterized protein LOC123508197 n=1 Tax=Portunus trituberculatus TaxID=210409 RepID=UPI001E1CE51C|nr:uncharacterized protein LOC123508197 [Portunus trituberculatus]
MARGRRQTRGDQRNLPTQPSPALPPESIQPSLVPFPTHPAKPSITSPPYPSAQPSTLPHPLSPAQYPKSPYPSSGQFFLMSEELLTQSSSLVHECISLYSADTALPGLCDITNQAPQHFD